MTTTVIPYSQGIIRNKDSCDSHQRFSFRNVYTYIIRTWCDKTAKSGVRNDTSDLKTRRENGETKGQSSAVKSNSTAVRILRENGETKGDTGALKTQRGNLETDLDAVDTKSAGSAIGENADKAIPETDEKDHKRNRDVDRPKRRPSRETSNERGITRDSKEALAGRKNRPESAKKNRQKDASPPKKSREKDASDKDDKRNTNVDETDEKDHKRNRDVDRPKRRPSRETSNERGITRDSKEALAGRKNRPESAKKNRQKDASPPKKSREKDASGKIDKRNTDVDSAKRRGKDGFKRNRNDAKETSETVGKVQKSDVNDGRTVGKREVLQRNRETAEVLQRNRETVGMKDISELLSQVKEDVVIGTANPDSGGKSLYNNTVL
ncbi:pre-mRNA-splicing factor 38B-like [Diaphorina citri]|uniref:Pre-mRNA-splicing factor 38B-like n=1 Tax=Diaphorina citri TaxID=121845 RepID=A0A3Q0JCQ8_DIACI|nr:pre-mRNA-splicing factor 38B-like [Diaphorina citri]